MSKQRWSTLFFSIALGMSASSPLYAKSLKIGVVPGVFADSVQVAASEAKKQGLDVELVEFTDWTTPNVALDAGDIDLNYYQNHEYLDNAIARQGFAIQAVSPGILSYLGLYSLKHPDLASIPQNAKVAIASDPVNIGRALRLLEAAKLVTLKPDGGLLIGLDDILSNPKNLQFIEIEGPQLARATPDVDLAQGFPYFIAASGAFDVSSGLVYSHYESPRFAIHFVARKDNHNDPDVQRFIEIYQNSAAVKANIHQSYKQDQRLYRLSWES